MKFRGFVLHDAKCYRERALPRSLAVWSDGSSISCIFVIYLSVFIEICSFLGQEDEDEASLLQTKDSSSL